METKTKTLSFTQSGYAEFVRRHAKRLIDGLRSNQPTLPCRAPARDLVRG